jgi:hypothetical protein
MKDEVEAAAVRLSKMLATEPKGLLDKISYWRVGRC